MPPEWGAGGKWLPAESPGAHADGHIEGTLVAERRRQMEPAGRIPDVAYRRAAVGVARKAERRRDRGAGTQPRAAVSTSFSFTDRKSTRLNSSHLVISYAVFCLKKKKKKN